jgi:hypothetical protein
MRANATVYCAAWRLLFLAGVMSVQLAPQSLVEKQPSFDGQHPALAGCDKTRFRRRLELRAQLCIRSSAAASAKFPELRHTVSWNVGRDSMSK